MGDGVEGTDVMPLQARNLAAPGSQQGKKPQSPSETQASRGGHSTLLWPPVFYHFFSAGAELLEETCRARKACENLGRTKWPSAPSCLTHHRSHVKVPELPTQLSASLVGTSP